MATTVKATAKFNTPEPVLESVTIELTPEAAECLLGQIAGLHCRPLGGTTPEYNWHVYCALQGAGVPRGATYDAAYQFIKKAQRA